MTLSVEAEDQIKKPRVLVNTGATKSILSREHINFIAAAQRSEATIYTVLKHQYSTQKA
jgi:hypothetical protein